MQVDLPLAVSLASGPTLDLGIDNQAQLLQILVTAGGQTQTISMTKGEFQLIVRNMMKIEAILNTILV